MSEKQSARKRLLATLAALTALTALPVAVSLRFHGILVAVIAGGAALLMLVLLVLAHRDRSGKLLSPAALLIVALVLALLFAAAVSQGQSGNQMQAFAEYGQTKKFTLPAILVMFGVFAIAAAARRSGPVRLPSWWRWLAVALAIATLGSFLVRRQPLNLLDVAQGLALLGGVLVLSWFGLSCHQWTRRQESALLATLFLASAAGFLLKNPLTPFASLLIPSTFAALLLGISVGRRRLPLLLVAAGLGTLMVRQLVTLNAVTPGGLSIAVEGEVAGCLLLVVVFLLPRALRLFLLVAAAVGGAVALVPSGMLDLLIGRWQGFTDVTLAQRGYETQQVLGLLSHSTISWLIGVGPGASVDLTGSPDAATLAASGRVLSAVPAVHLLSSWLLLKLGLAGLIWAVLFAAGLGRLITDLSRRNDVVWDRALLMFVTAGVVSGLPAATNVFTNPLPALFIGVLVARARFRNDVGGETPPSERCASADIPAADDVVGSPCCNGSSDETEDSFPASLMTGVRE